MAVYGERMTDTGNESHVEHRAVSYIDKSRKYYRAHGYEQPYRWATYSEVPFHLPETPLRDVNVGIVTTAFPIGAELAKVAYTQPSAPIPEQMFTDDLSWDKMATHTDDVGSFLPLAALERLVHAGVVARASARFYGVPTEYSHRRSHLDAEHIREWCLADGVDVAVLVPI